MSRAFVKEDDAGASELPDRPISPHRNFVTPAGLAQIESEIDRLRRLLGQAQADENKPLIASTSRDLRYWSARRASAELTAASLGPEVRFGSTFLIERGDGRRQTFTITGEDEADPSRGKLSYVSPLARALIGKSPGDEITFMGDSVVVLSAASPQPI